MKSQLYTNIALTLVVLLLAVLVLQNFDIIHTPIKEITGDVEITNRNSIPVEVDQPVSVEIER